MRDILQVTLPVENLHVDSRSNFSIASFSFLSRASFRLESMRSSIDAHISSASASSSSWVDASRPNNPASPPPTLRRLPRVSSYARVQVSRLVSHLSRSTRHLSPLPASRPCPASTVARARAPPSRTLSSLRSAPVPADIASRREPGGASGRARDVLSAPAGASPYRDGARSARPPRRTCVPRAPRCDLARSRRRARETTDDGGDARGRRRG